MHLWPGTCLHLTSIRAPSQPRASAAAAEEGAEGEEGEEPQSPAEGFRLLVTVKDGAKGQVMQVSAPGGGAPRGGCCLCGPPFAQLGLTRNASKSARIFSLLSTARAQVGAFVTDHLRIHRVTLYPIGAEPTPNQVFGGFDELPAYSGECVCCAAPPRMGACVSCHARAVPVRTALSTGSLLPPPPPLLCRPRVRRAGQRAAERVLRVPGGCVREIRKRQQKPPAEKSGRVGF